MRKFPAPLYGTLVPGISGGSAIPLQAAVNLPLTPRKRLPPRAMQPWAEGLFPCSTRAKAQKKAGQWPAVFLFCQTDTPRRRLQKGRWVLAMPALRHYAKWQNVSING